MPVRSVKITLPRRKYDSMTSNDPYSQFWECKFEIWEYNRMCFFRRHLSLPNSTKISLTHFSGNAVNPLENYPIHTRKYNVMTSNVPYSQYWVQIREYNRMCISKDRMAKNYFQTRQCPIFSQPVVRFWI